MRLWTIQPIAFYVRLRTDGRICCDPSLACNLIQTPDAFQTAYNWMAEQLRKRVEMPPDDVRYPIWAWYALDGKHQKPDLRRTEFRFYHGNHVCLEVEIPDSEVLLSDEEAWHIVLNDAYISAGENIDAEYAWFEALPEDQRRRVKRESWERIFDIFNPGASCLFIQAVFWQLRLDQVRDVRVFKGSRGSV